MYRIGQSNDIHQLVVGRDLILGGVNIPFEKGLLGHSDADCLIHSIAEAIIGALGMKDLGTHFPDTDPQFKGISSLVILRHVCKMMDDKGYMINNIDSLIMIEKPKMAPYLALMKENIACALNCDEDLVNIKATRGEKLGFIGRNEGVMCSTSLLLRRKDI
ncbi:MAG: 2-C-methyl-D-erythritol 2,4-cyclodiphosphate synthase [Erysipelotrichaceae bacterium]